MDSDEGLELCPLDLGQVLCGLVNQDVQQVQESLVRLLHDFPVVAGVGQSLCGVSCPYHLDTQDSNLKQTDQNHFLNLFLEFKQAFNFKTYIWICMLKSLKSRSFIILPELKRFPYFY